MKTKKKIGDITVKVLENLAEVTNECRHLCKVIYEVRRDYVFDLKDFSDVEEKLNYIYEGLTHVHQKFLIREDFHKVILDAKKLNK